MEDLRARPLTSQDQALYVEREVDRQVRRAVEAGENVVLGAVRGMGTTSMLFRLERDLPDAVYINGEYAEDADTLLASVAARLKLPLTPFADLGELVARKDPLAPPRNLASLRSGLESSGRKPVILIDGPIDPLISFSLFGRWRDETFAVPATWLVAAHIDRLGEYVTPPADVFFDEIITIDELRQDEATDLLFQRGAWDELTTSDREALVTRFDGTPRHLLRLTRQQLDRPDSKLRFDEDGESPSDPTAEIGRGAGMLLAEMQGRGPVAATDHDMLRRLGVTSRQMRRNLANLETHGLVEQVPGGQGTPGRPALRFQLTQRGKIRAGAV